MDSNLLLTVSELAEELEVHKSWVYSRTRLSGSGAIANLRVGNILDLALFSLNEVLPWLKEQDSQSASQQGVVLSQDFFTSYAFMFFLSSACNRPCGAVWDDGLRKKKT